MRYAALRVPRAAALGTGYRLRGVREAPGAGRRPQMLKRYSSFWKLLLPRKEVIQPHVPVRLPCYDFTPLAPPTFDASLLEGWADGFG